MRPRRRLWAPRMMTLVSDEDKEPDKHEKATPDDPVAPIHVGPGPKTDGTKTDQEKKLEKEQE